jgi:hypothetical protein
MSSRQFCAQFMVAPKSIRRPSDPSQAFFVAHVFPREMAGVLACNPWREGRPRPALSPTGASQVKGLPPLQKLNPPQISGSSSLGFGLR